MEAEWRLKHHFNVNDTQVLKAITVYTFAFWGDMLYYSVDTQAPTQNSSNEIVNEKTQ